RPGYLEPHVDPTFKTPFMRVTDPGRALLDRAACHRDYCRHRYSSTQAWNADQSLLLITEGCAPGLCFLDGRTYEPLFARRVSQYHDCKWHPVLPDKMICVHRSGIALWSPRQNVWESIFEPADYGSLEFGPYKGNPSIDGRLVALRARNKKTLLVAF